MEELGITEICTEEAVVLCCGELPEKENLAEFRKRPCVTRIGHDAGPSTKRKWGLVFQDCPKCHSHHRWQNQVQGPSEHKVWCPGQLHRSHAHRAGLVQVTFDQGTESDGRISDDVISVDEVLATDSFL